MNMPTHLYQRLLIWLLASTLLVSAVFTSFPQVDIAVSALFYHDSFWLLEVAALERVRQGLIWFMYAFAVGCLVALLWAGIRRRPAQALGFAVFTILLGPLLLVNGILKSYWGRARPIEISQFGGDKTFSPAYYFSDQCTTNCAFTSGEGAGIATAAILIGFLAWPHITPRGRWALGGVLGVLVVLGAGLRVATGKHFLSDTLLSILFCALVAAVVYRWFFPAQKTDSYKVNYISTTARHAQLGHKISLMVPSAAQHRPAVEVFLKGRYYEAFSHLSFKKVLEHRPGNAVHAGAFFGDMLHTFASFADKVYAFEPVLDNYLLAKRNAAMLGLDNVALFNAGLGREAGFAIMQTRTGAGVFRGGASSIVQHENPDPSLTEQVPIMALDDMSIANVSLLHLDVEGYEYEVLLGAKRLIAASKPVIMIEDNKQNCAQLLKEMGYQHAFHRGSLHYWAMPADIAFVSQLNTD